MSATSSEAAVSGLRPVLLDLLAVSVLPPMTFQAADFLLEPGITVQAVADRVGDGSGFALSAAFKRTRGVSPSEHRRRSVDASVTV